MRELLRSSSNKLLTWIRNLPNNFPRRRGEKSLPDEELRKQANTKKKIDKDKKKLEDQEARSYRQGRELEEAQAAIRILRAQLNTLGDSGSHKGDDRKPRNTH